MARLRNLQNNDSVYLRSHHTFGRRVETVDTCIKKPEISKIHAALEYIDNEWVIRDLGRNGTWLNDKRLPPNNNVTLRTGDLLHFANPDCNSWLIEDLSPSGNLLIGQNHDSNTQPLSSYNLLPDQENPLAALYFCNHRLHWRLEIRCIGIIDSEERQDSIIQPGEVFGLGRFLWQLFIDDQQQQTLELASPQATANDCLFIFQVSLDEEHTQLTITLQNEVADLGERSHHYLLLHLARLKAQHANEGVDEQNQGWINNDQLAKELGLDPSHINIQIFRARKQMADAFPAAIGLAELLERRRGSVRFNCPKTHVKKGAFIEPLSC